MDTIPILKLDDVLLISIQIDLSDQTAVALQDALAERITATGARGVVIDISALEIVDSFIGRILASTASMSRLLDAETVVVGMRPAVAITLVELGLSLGEVRTALNLEKGLIRLREAWAADAVPDHESGTPTGHEPETAPSSLLAGPITASGSR